MIIQVNESNASRRVVPLPPLVQSNGTSACTNESGRTFYFSVGGIDYGSGGSISAISAAMGLYECLFSASKVSAMGQGRVYYGGVNSSSTAMVASTPIEVVQWNSYDSMRLGLFALPNVAAEAAGGLITSGTGTGQLSVSNGSVGLKAQTHSQATVGGINNILAGTYSDVSFSIRNGGIQTVSVGAGNYSGMSVEVKTKGIATSSIETANIYSSLTIGGVDNITPRTYSGVSVQIQPNTYSGVSVRVEAQDYGSIVTVGVSNIKAASYSGVSVEVKSGGIQTSSMGAGSYSGVSIEVKTGGIQTTSIGAGAYSGVTVDGAKFLSVAGERSIASSLLSTNLGGTRTIQQSFHAIRNRVQISGSTMTVYLEDDTTSSWTATVSTGTATVYQIDPGIS